MSTFVLIPGAGTDPRVYRATIEALGGLGHDALAPPLPLDDEQATPSDHADAIAEGVPEGREVVIVAQSSERSPARSWRPACPWPGSSCSPR